jgi:hypothetical protein
MNDDILICDNHPEYKVPFISTMAFNQAELWCPYCGRVAGSFDGIGEHVKRTEALLGRLYVYKKYSDYFLEARGKLFCAYFETDKGLKISANGKEGVIKMPDDMKEYLKMMIDPIRKGWNYNVKASILMKTDIMELAMDQFSCQNCRLETLTDPETKCDIKCVDAWKDLESGGYRTLCDKFEFKQGRQKW